MCKRKIVFLTLISCLFFLVPIILFSKQSQSIVVNDYELVVPQASQTATPGTVTGLKATAAGKNRVTLSWKAVANVDGYLIYAQKRGSYGYAGMTTSGTSFTDVKALDDDWNFYWVFAYVKNNSGKMITGKCEKYVFAKGVCANVRSLKAYSAGKNKVTLTWSPVSGAEGYLVYAKKNNVYGYVGMTTLGTTFTDSKALDKDYNYYFVFAYYKNSNGQMIQGGCDKYAYEKGICPGVTNLTANSSPDGVSLSWNKVNTAVGYLIYGKTKTGTYGYKGMTTGTTWSEKKASIEEFNFYWVFPYHKDSSGKMIVGKTASYVFGKRTAKPVVLTDKTYQGMPTIKPTVIYNKNGIKISVQELYREKYSSGEYIKFLVENNTTRNIAVSSDSVLVEGYTVADLFVVKVASGKKAYDSMWLSASSLEATGINCIGEIEMYLRIYDTDTYDTIERPDCITIRTSAYGYRNVNKSSSGKVLYKANGIKIEYRYIDVDELFGPDIYFYIENNSDQNVIIQVDELAINGYMVTELFSCKVFSGRKAVDEMSLLSSSLEENGITTVRNVSLKFKIIDENYYTICTSNTITFTV